MADTQDPTSCLFWYGDGCSVITDSDLCLSSRDGRPWRDWKGMEIYGQPCVWCGGAICSNETDSLCAPKSAVEDELSDNASTLQEASCANGPTSLPLSELPTPGAVLDGTFALAPARGQPGTDHACRGDYVTDAKRSNDNYYWTFTANSLERCQAFCLAKDKCNGIDYQARTSICQVWWKQIKWTQATPGHQCYKVVLANESEPTGNPERQCLRWEQGVDGCAGIADRDTCLTSRDGRAATKLRGMRVHGEPCAWCEGDSCDVLGDNKSCEALHIMQNGHKHHYFQNAISPDNITAAVCVDGAPQVGGERPRPPLPPAPRTSEPLDGCAGEAYLHLTMLSSPAETGDTSIEVLDGDALVAGQEVIISDLQGERLDENADMATITARMATEGHNSTTAQVTSTEGQGSSTLVKLEAALTESFPAGSYVGSHACKSNATAAVLGSALPAAPVAAESGMPWWVWAALVALVLGCTMVLVGALLKAKSKSRSARNATRRTRKVETFDDDEEVEPMLPKEDAAQEFQPVRPANNLATDPRLVPRVLTMPRLQVPYNMVAPAPMYAPVQYVSAVPMQPAVPATTMQRVSSAVVLQTPGAHQYLDPPLAEPVAFR